MNSNPLFLEVPKTYDAPLSEFLRNRSCGTPGTPKQDRKRTLNSQVNFRIPAPETLDVFSTNMKSNMPWLRKNHARYCSWPFTLYARVSYVVCVTSRISKKLGVKVRTNLQSSTFRAVQSAEASCTFGEFGIMHVELWSLLLTSRESGTRLHIVPMPPMPRTRLRNKASAEERMVLVVSHHKHVEKPRVTFFTRPVAETPVSIERPLQSKAPQKACRLRLRTALRQWSSKGPTLLRCPEQLPGIRASLGTLMLRLPCHRVKVHLATVLCASILHTANLHDHSPLPEPQRPSIPAAVLPMLAKGMSLAFPTFAWPTNYAKSRQSATADGHEVFAKNTS